MVDWLDFEFDCTNRGSKHEWKQISTDTRSTEDYIDGLDNKNTKETTIWDVYLLKNFLKYKNEERELHKIPPEDLYEYLAELMLSVRWKDR